MIKKQNFNNDWLFSYDGFEDIDLNTQREFKVVTLPHDYSIEMGYDKEKGDGATGYLVGGKACYKKEFKLDQEQLKKKVAILFDGIFCCSTIFINGKKAITHKNGSTPIYVELNKYLVKEEKQLIEVYVDHSNYIDTRWYSGSGIYRDVHLLIFDKTYIKPMSEKITCDVNSEVAIISYSALLVNENNTPEDVNLQYSIKSKDGVLFEKTKTISIDANSSKLFGIKEKINSPNLWSIDNPYLYKFNLKNNDNVYEETFGIRTIRFDSNKGFFLNDKSMKIKGVCLHQDGGLVGAALKYDVIKRRLLILKNGGCNAIRGAHNPLSTVFLEVCDEIGLLVQEEFFDEWDYPKDKRLNGKEKSVDTLTRGYNRFFHECCKEDLQSTIELHYNHPSIFMWSLGNEIEWTYEANAKATGYFDANTNGDYFWNAPLNTQEGIKKNYESLKNEVEYQIENTASLLSSYVKEIDTKRFVTANCILPSVSFVSGYTDSLDIVGCSYRRVMYDLLHSNYPDKPLIGNENVGQYHEWKAVKERDFVSGLFLWTGIDYIGETLENEWPMKANRAGLLDVAGFEKPSYYLFKTLWNDTPSISIYTQTEDKSAYRVCSDGNIIDKKNLNWEHRLWYFDDVNDHYNYNEGEKLIVEIYSNEESIELFQNGNSLGMKKLVDQIDGIYKFSCTYQAGSLEAIGPNCKKSLTTAFEINKIKLVADKTKIKKGQCSHIVLSLQDKNNTKVSDRDVEVSFEIDGNLRVLGYDNGSHLNVTNHLKNTFMTNKGKALMIVESTSEGDGATITATSNNISQSIVIEGVK
jgi:beta-galactosidase/beta-glucuronidase